MAQIQATPPCLHDDAPSPPRLMQSSRYRLLAALPLVLIGFLLGQWGSSRWQEQAQSQDLRTLSDAYTTIQRSYVDSVSGNQLTEDALRKMTRGLDSFSVYIEPAQLRHIENAFQGEFDGIGISYERIDGPRGQDTIFVASVTPGGPSAQAGVRAGDRIVGVAGTTAVGWAHETIRSRLMGPKGTTVDVTLRRPTRTDPREVTITRGTVPMESVAAHYMLDERTGYIRLTRFARTTHDELRRALRRLDEQGMERLVFDLRGNAGGLLSVAERVADEFLVEDQLIVSSRSRHSEYSGARYASEEGLFEDRPLILLIDGQSASASEIVAGALQDHDRALLVGRRTFGKGLVQRQYDLPDASALRLTIARYHTPSGRRVQRPGAEATLHPWTDTTATVDSTSVPDSLRYQTDAGRQVIGGGGIVPDRRVAPLGHQSSILDSEQASRLLQSFARRWIDRRADSLRSVWEGRPEAFVNTYQLPSSIYSQVLRFARQDREGLGLPSTIDSTARARIERYLRGRVGQRLFGPEVALRVRNASDPVLDAAEKAWSESERRARSYPVQNSRTE